VLGILASRGLQYGVEAHMRRALDYGATYMRGAVYLHTADNYHRLTRPTFTGAKRPR
jgi:hypothetical protein